MAWSFVGIGTAVEVTATTHTLIEPAGVVAGDLLVAGITSRIASTTPVTLPTGGEWTLVGQKNTSSTVSTSSAVPSGLMAYCIRGASPPNLTFTHPVAPSVAIGRVVAYRGHAITAPLDVSSSQQTATATTPISVTGLTTTQDDDLIVAFVHNGQESGTRDFNATSPSGASGTTTNTVTTPPAGTWKQRGFFDTGTGADCGIWFFDAVKQTAGATGNFTATAVVSAAHVVNAGAFKIHPNLPKAAPTLVSTYAGGVGSIDSSANWASEADGASRTTTSFSVQTGDVLVALGASGDDVYTFAAAGPSGGSLTWTRRQDPTVTTNFGRVAAWTAIVDSAKSMTVSWVNDGSTGARPWGFIVYHFRGSDGVGFSTASSVAATAPSLTSFASGNNSAIAFISSDWDALDGASRTWRTLNSITPTSGNGLEKVYFRDAALYTVYSALWNDAGAYGSQTTGLTAPTGQEATMIAIEVLGATPSIADAWNANDKSASIGLSNSDKTATTITTAIGGVRSTTTYTSGTAGKYYAEFVIGSTLPFNFGLTPTSNALDGLLLNARVTVSSGAIVINATSAGSLGAFVAGDVLSVAWDAGTETIWFRRNANSWNATGADPGSAAGGLDCSFAAATPHALWGRFANSQIGDSLILRTELAEYTQAVPSGFTSWMGEASGPTAYTLPADAGSYALTGQTASLEKSRFITADVASYALTGQPVTLSKVVSYRLASDTGSYALTGVTAGLYRGREVLAVAGSYGLSGTAASLEWGREAAADPGSYALTGQTASLELGKEVLALGGSYALSGIATSLEYGREVLAIAGTYALTGVAASLELGKEVLALAGFYAVSGAVATLAKTWKAAAVVGAYTLTGIPVNLLKPGAYAIIGLPGAYALTGTTASLVYVGRVPLVAESGSYALTGADATLVEAVPAEAPPVYRSTANTTYASRSAETVCPPPAGIVDGDILIAGIFAGRGDSSLAAAVKIDITPPVGWTQIGTDTEVYDGAGFTGSFQVYWKRAAGEAGDYTFSHTGTETTYSTQAVIAAYSNCAATGDPVDQFSQNAASTGATATATGITTTIVNTKLIYLGHNWNASATLTPPTGTAERFDHLAYLSDEDWAVASATGDRTQTLASSNPWSAFLVALKPQMIPLGLGMVQADAGSYALAGTAAVLHKSMEIAAEAGAYALLGTPATLKPSDYDVVGVAGSYALDGPPAPLVYSGETRTPPVYRAIASTSFALRTNTTVSKPSGTVVGDILLAALVQVKEITPPGAVTPPEGWLQIDDTTSVHDITSTYGAFSVFWKRATASEPDDYTFTHAAASSQAEILAYDDCVPLGNPIDAYSVTFGNTNNNLDYPGSYWIDYAGVTTTDINSKLVLLSHNWSGAGHLPPGLVPGPTVVMTERFDSLVYASDETIANSGPTGLRVMQHGGPDPFAGLLIALKPLTATPVYSTTGAAGSYGITGVDAIIEGGLIVLPGIYALTGADARLSYSEEVIEPPVTPIIGGGGGTVPKKQMRKAVRELLKREEKRKGRKKPKVLAREILEVIEAKGLGVQEKRIAIRLIGEALRLELPSLFYSQPLIRDKEQIARAILFIIEAAMQRIADEEEDEEAALLLLSAA